ncbi:MAG TPA: iron ABC transporter permease [Pseudogracilibacillus sp.]|nr:iron ABC transporter permease [Pseudogracilibacillus sp.]
MIHPTLRKKQHMMIALFIGLILGTIVIGMGVGYSPLPFDRIIPTMIGQGDFKESFILFSIRLPRMIITLLAGMALALSGAILQGITRNDLADPGIIGINTGAGVGVAVFFLFFPIEVGTFVYLIPVVAFISALLTAVLIYLFSYKKKSGIEPIRLVLVGVGFSLAFSGLMIILISSAEKTKVDFIAQWLAGSVWGTDWPFIYALLPWLVILIPFTLFKASRLDILRLSSPVAIGVGLPIQKEQIIMLLTAVALAASAVSVSGGITFIGLMAPHIAKSLVGPRHQLFIPISILLGGWLLLLADLVGFHLLEKANIPAGVMVSLIGAPYFIYLLTRRSTLN